MQHIEVERPVPFLRLPASGEIRLADVHDHLAALSIDTGVQLHLRPFIQVRLAREGLVTGYREELERIAEDFPVRLVEVRVQPSTVIASILGSEADPFFDTYGSHSSRDVQTRLQEEDRERAERRSH
jgi:exonuclease SbcD